MWREQKRCISKGIWGPGPQTEALGSKSTQPLKAGKGGRGLEVRLGKGMGSFQREYVKQPHMDTDLLSWRLFVLNI